MSALCCTAVKSNGQPCAAHALPGGDLCLFHDPAHQDALAQSRSQGGSTPRRTCRYPLLLDYKHVAELLSEILIEAMNDPAAYDSQRLRALTGLANTLLKAVGRPKDSYELHADRGEPAADEDHQLRIYPPEPPELASLLAADAEIEAAEISLDESAPAAPPEPSAPAPDPAHRITPTPEHSDTPAPVPAAIAADVEGRFCTAPEAMREGCAADPASPPVSYTI
jgi:hypothetical protein